MRSTVVMVSFHCHTCNENKSGPLHTLIDVRDINSGWVNEYTVECPDCHTEYDVE